MISPVIGLHEEYSAVEDERENWRLLERLLQNAGFEYAWPRMAPRESRCFETGGPNFIWMDLRMPVMDGVEAAGRIRALDGGRDVRIAAVIAWSLSRVPWPKVKKREHHYIGEEQSVDASRLKIADQLDCSQRLRYWLYRSAERQKTLGVG